MPTLAPIAMRVAKSSEGALIVERNRNLTIVFERNRRLTSNGALGNMVRSECAVSRREYDTTERGIQR